MSINIHKPYSMICQRCVPYVYIRWEGWRNRTGFWKPPLRNRLLFWKISACLSMRWNAWCKIFSVTVQAASFWMVTFSLASSSSSDELEPIKSSKGEGWKSREMVKVSGAGYYTNGKRTLKRWGREAMESGTCTVDSPRAIEVFRSGRRAVTCAADGRWRSGISIPSLSVTSETCTEQPCCLMYILLK